MALDREKHELKNALLFLKTFPEIVRGELSIHSLPVSEELAEILEIHEQKLAVLEKHLTCV